jgi:3-deoxy-D-manno-octulosonate 8-phosphate phosphatase (KDO 8-P phosphatase)
MASVLERAALIRLLVLDVDGVLTDGRLYFDAHGEALKVFHVRDGAGMVQLLKNGIQIAIITGRSSPHVDTRMRELGVEIVHQGVQDKLAVLQSILSKLNLATDQVAVVGDDAAEVPLFNVAKLAVAVADAHNSARSAAHHVTQANGGCGAVREVCDLILQARSS